MTINNKLLSPINGLIGLLIFVFPAAIFAIPKGGNTVALILLLSLLGLTLNRSKVNLDKGEKYFVLSFAVYFLVVALNIWWFDGELRDLDVASRFLLILPIFFFIRKSTLSVKWFLWGVVAAAMLAGLTHFFTAMGFVASIDTQIKTTEFSLFSLHLSIPFTIYLGSGNMSLVASIFGLIGLFSLNKNNSFVLNIALLLSFFFGMSATLMSGGRGVWLAAIASFGIVYLFNTVAWSKKARLLSVTAFIIVFVIGYVTPQSGVKGRIDLAIDSITQYIETGNTYTSAGARLGMWSSSSDIIKRHWIMGVGEDNYLKTQQQLVEDGLAEKGTDIYRHPHGEYLATLIEQGIIGLISLLFLFIYPVSYLLTSLKDGLFNHQQRMLASAGLVLIFHYIFYSITAGVFAHQSTALFFVTMLSVIMGYISSKRST
jgi:O-antigen ligase